MMYISGACRAKIKHFLGIFFPVCVCKKNCCNERKIKIRTFCILQIEGIKFLNRHSSSEPRTPHAIFFTFQFSYRDIPSHNYVSPWQLFKLISSISNVEWKQLNFTQQRVNSEEPLCHVTIGYQSLIILLLRNFFPISFSIIN